MILTHLRKSWAKVQSGEESKARATLGEWAQLPADDERLAPYADVVAGVHDNVIVSVYDVTGWTRNPETGRIMFQGVPSTKWAHLEGVSNPGKHWGQQGYARSVQCLDTRDVAEIYPPGDSTDGQSAHRAVVAGFTLTVDPADPLTATVIPAAGGRVFVAPAVS